VIDAVVSLLSGMPLALVGFLAALAAGAFTGVGALPVLWGRRIGGGGHEAMLGFAAGVMLAATAFSLVLPGIEAAAAQTGSEVTGAVGIAGGMLLGALGILWLNRHLPHEHFVKGVEGGDPRALRRVWLFVIAITLHNVPEGMAVGVGFGGGDIANGLPLTVGMALQNAPEGLAVAAALYAEGYGRVRAFAIAALTGLIEALGGGAAAGTVALAAPLLPGGMALAAGAMLFVISHEIIPETHRRGRETKASLGVMVGFAVMTVLDVALG
jgi:ZIP family zinc transporter